MKAMKANKRRGAPAGVVMACLIAWCCCATAGALFLAGPELCVGVMAAAPAADPPQQIHIALAGKDSNGNSNGMAVSWQTINATATSVVEYGTNRDNLTLTAQGSCATYYLTYDHHVVLSNLQPATEYFYRVGDHAAGMSRVLSFTSAPLSSKDTTLDFAVWGDLGVIHGEATMEFLRDRRKDLDLLWHAGDISYADDAFIHWGCDVDFCYEKTYNEYMNDFEETVAYLPYMTTPGNHEAECHSPACLLDEPRKEALRNFTAYNHRFRMPSAESGGVLNMWHSFNYGPVHFVSIDTDTAYPGAPEEHQYVLPCGGFGDMLTWLENDLKEANATRHLRPWIFVASHHPMYHAGGINKGLQAAVEDLFMTYGVDVYFAGHVHAYERDWPVYKGVPDSSYTNTKKPVHIIVGGAGNDEMAGDQQTQSVVHHETEYAQVNGTLIPLPDDTWVQGPPTNQAVAAFSDTGFFGIGLVHVNLTTVHFEYYRTTLQTKHDEVYITKTH